MAIHERFVLKTFQKLVKEWTPEKVQHQETHGWRIGQNMFVEDEAQNPEELHAFSQRQLRTIKRLEQISIGISYFIYNFY